LNRFLSRFEEALVPSSDIFMLALAVAFFAAMAAYVAFCSRI